MRLAIHSALRYEMSLADMRHVRNYVDSAKLAVQLENVYDVLQ